MSKDLRGAPAHQVWWECAHPQRRNGTDKIKNGDRRHLEFCLDGIFGFIVIFCIYAQNLSQISRPDPGQLWLFFTKSKMAVVRLFWNC